MKLGNRSQRLTQIAALTAIVAAAFVVASNWYDNWSNSQERLASAAGGIARIQWIIDHRVQIEANLDQQKANLATYKTTYVEADTQDHAAAELQKRIKQAITDTGGSISSAQPIVFQSDGKEKSAAARFRITMPSTKMGDLFYRLEMQLPILFIDQAEIARVNPTLGDSGGGILAIQFDSHLYWRADKDAK